MAFARVACRSWDVYLMLMSRLLSNLANVKESKNELTAQKKEYYTILLHCGGQQRYCSQVS